MSKGTQKLIDDMNKKADNRQSVVDRCVDEERPIPLNYILEARHFKLQARILKLQAELNELDSADAAHPTRIRLQETIAQAKEIGGVNNVLLDLRKYNKDIFIADR